MTTKETTTELVRVSSKLVEYIKHIQKRYKDEYKVNIEFTEASLILADRARENMLFN